MTTAIFVLFCLPFCYRVHCTRFLPPLLPLLLLLLSVTREISNESTACRVGVICLFLFEAFAIIIIKIKKTRVIKTFTHRTHTQRIAAQPRNYTPGSDFSPISLGLIHSGLRTSRRRLFNLILPFWLLFVGCVCVPFRRRRKMTGFPLSTSLHWTVNNQKQTSRCFFPWNTKGSWWRRNLSFQSLKESAA